MTPPRTITIAGLTVTVGTEAECEAVTAVICGPVSSFADDVHSFCAWCQTPIVHRPYVPRTPPKICLRCALTLATTKES